jgi:2-methylcitrate dehydratase
MTFQRDLAWQQIELTYRASVAHQFARYALALNYDLLPEQVVHQAKRCVLDALGCAIGAYDAPGRLICENTVKAIGGPPEATVFCSGLRTNALNASLVNSFLVRFLDYNDWGGGGHNSDALASILAMAEREKSSGKDFLTSLVISYELGARFQKSHTDRFTLEKLGWASDVRGGLNQPPAIGKLMGLNEEQIANAIGICLSHALPLGILDANREENVMAKNLRFGWVAHDAMLACMLAQNGFTGPVRIVESDHGIGKVLLHGEIDFERLTDFSGWRIMDVKFKAMPANATTHGHVFATLALVEEHDLKPEDIAAVNIRAPLRESLHTTTPAKKYPRTAENADHSAFYANALAIKERAFGPDSINPEKFTDPVVLDLIEKITVTGDPSMGFIQGASEIITKDGRHFEKFIDVPRGLGEGSQSDKELEEKFAEMASVHLSDAHIGKIFDACWNIEKLGDLAELTRLMVFPEKKS